MPRYPQTPLEDLQEMISVVVPALNEADGIGETVQHVRASVSGCEVIVVDGGSQDDTVGIARANGARVIQSTKGRARQQNAGAVEARGNVLLFLHADTKVGNGVLNPRLWFCMDFGSQL